MAFSDIFKIKQFKTEIAELKKANNSLQEEKSILEQKMSEIGGYEYFELQEIIHKDKQEHFQRVRDLNQEFLNLRKTKESELENHLKTISQRCNELAEKNSELEKKNEDASHELAKLIKSVKTQTNKLTRSKELIRAIDYALEGYFNYEPVQSSFKFSPEQLADLEELSPTIILKLHCMDVKDLRKAYRANDKQISDLLSKYASRYTTKANKAIYNLMVIALRAELQNILYNLKYEKLDHAIEQVKNVTQKYLKIAGDGNQSIVSTLTKFIGEVEYLFINAVKIEYNYYVKREQAKQEQLAIREQMRQEAEERKALEAEKKKVEKEEAKFNSQIETLKEQLAQATEDEMAKLNARILDLQAQLANVIVKKEEITSLANGKAGNVYVISNLGSFGENVFKIGMTRRLNPQDRVNELGDASVPFKFDVHSFIFSDDAVGLESKLHNILNDKRVNKVNLRKEFFYTTVDELEQLVTEIEPTAEFNKTMLAEEFRQSLSTNENYSSDYDIDDEIFE